MQGFREETDQLELEERKSLRIELQKWVQNCEPVFVMVEIMGWRIDFSLWICRKHSAERIAPETEFGKQRRSKCVAGWGKLW